MIAPIAALIFASAMALSLSVEGESFFHAPMKASAEPSEGEPAAPDDGSVAPTSAPRLDAATRDV